MIKNNKDIWHKTKTNFKIGDKIILLHYDGSPLRSSGTGLLAVPRVKTKAAYSFFAPHNWNKLPENCRSATTQQG